MFGMIVWTLFVLHLMFFLLQHPMVIILPTTTKKIILFLLLDWDTYCVSFPLYHYQCITFNVSSHPHLLFNIILNMINFLLMSKTLVVYITLCEKNTYRSYCASPYLRSLSLSLLSVTNFLSIFLHTSLSLLDYGLGVKKKNH